MIKLSKLFLPKFWKIFLEKQIRKNTLEIFRKTIWKIFVKCFNKISWNHFLIFSKKKFGNNLKKKSKQLKIFWKRIIYLKKFKKRFFLFLSLFLIFLMNYFWNMQTRNKLEITFFFEKCISCAKNIFLQKILKNIFQWMKSFRINQWQLVYGYFCAKFKDL